MAAPQAAGPEPIIATLNGPASECLSDFVTLATYSLRSLSRGQAPPLLRARDGCLRGQKIVSPATIAEQSPGRNQRDAAAGERNRHFAFPAKVSTHKIKRAGFAQQKRPSDQHGWSEGLPNNPGCKCGPTLASRRSTSKCTLRAELRF